MTTAFQANAFQNNAFQIDSTPPVNVAHVGGPGFNLSFEQAQDRRKLRSDLERAVLGIEEAADEVPAIVPVMERAHVVMSAAPTADPAALLAIAERINSLLVEADRLYRQQKDEEEAELLLLMN